MTTEVGLAIVAALFCAYMVWRFRPTFGAAGGAEKPRGALRDARRRVEAATNATDRALALCDAGDACASSLRPTSAIGYYLRAMRSDPGSKALVERAAKGLSRRPHALEALLWRRLGAEPWTGNGREAAMTALASLAHLYERSLHNRPRARAIDFALEALGAPARHGDREHQGAQPAADEPREE